MAMIIGDTIIGCEIDGKCVSDGKWIVTEFVVEEVEGVEVEKVKRDFYYPVDTFHSEQTTGREEVESEILRGWMINLGQS